MNKGILTVVLVVLIVGSVAGAAVIFLFPYDPLQPPSADDSGSSEEGIQQVVNANNQFAFDLYSELVNEEDDNIFFSPYSISSAFAMTFEGADGQTADEIETVFHFPEYSILRPNFAAIYNNINREIRDYELRTGNALWVQKDYPFLEDYMSTVEKYYGGKAANLDFVEETEQSRQTINNFIEEQTNYKIEDLIPPGVLDTATRLVLTNAIYFKGTWVWQFDKSDTRDRDFKITPTNIVKTPTMFMDNDKAEFNYADLGHLQILELPYKGDKISMLILLPNETLDDVEPILTAENLKDWKSEMESTKLDAIYIPKFEFETKYFMVDTLTSMGMPTPFTWPGADFSGMDGTKNLYISNVIHQAYVKVDEEGTEAAAATAIVMTLGSALPRNVFNADHPFIFLIQEKETGNILFLGRIVNPNN
jgi:serpin B